MGIIPFKLAVYNRFYTTSDSGFYYWMMTTVGEPPVIFDSTLLPSSANLMSDYLVSKGYLFPRVDYEYEIKRKKARVKFKVETGPLYTIDSIFFPMNSSPLSWIIRGNEGKTYLKTGNAFDVDQLSKEQSRIVRDYQNVGYFYFRKDFIFYNADTTIGDHRVNLYVRLQEDDSLPEQQTYGINNIYIYSDYNPQYDLGNVQYDTVLYNGLYFLSTRKFIDPKILSTAIFLTKGTLYSRNDYDCTLNRVSDLGVFKFANVRFVRADSSSGVKNSLNCFIYLQPAKKLTLGGEIEVGNVESNFASGVRLSFGDKNVAAGANRFDISTAGGIQVPVLNKDSLFYSLNGQINYYIPKFAFPFIHPKISCYNNPVTKISLKGNLFEQTNLYSLQNYGISYSMEWKEVDYPLKKFIFPIIAMSYVFPTYTPAFAERLALDPFLKQSFSKQFIPSLGYAFIFSNQKFDRTANFTYLRLDLETAGNLFYLGNTVIQRPRDSTGSYSFYGVDFSQYVRYEVDVRHYFQFTRNRALVLRLDQGTAYAYGNSKVVPYVKQFYVGGTSSLRSWKVRSLGPGAYNDTSNFYNSAGDIKAEVNAEYRFNLIGRLKGAAFVDAGNIWLLRDDPQKPGGAFKFDEFYRQIAVGSGVGLRLDFTYFIMRFDLATRVYDPSYAEGERWVIKDFSLKKGETNTTPVFQFAVGYPF